MNSQLSRLVCRARRVWRVGLCGAACIVAACGGAGSSTEAPPLPTDLPDLTQPRLLSDAELTVSVKASSWEPDATSRQWLQANHTKMRSLVVDSDFSDLEPLRTQLAGRRLVLLGESSHGSREFNLAKLRLVKFMHQQLGYGECRHIDVFVPGLAHRRAGRADALHRQHADAGQALAVGGL
jgi:hypothetical protein